MPVYKNSNKIGKVLMGTTAMARIYMGSTLVYQNTPPISWPPATGFPYVLPLVNPDAESGMTGWTINLGAVSAALGPAGDGTYGRGGALDHYFYAENNAFSQAYQDHLIPAAYHSLCDAGELLLVTQWWQCCSGTDEQRLQFSFHDDPAALTTIGTYLPPYSSDGGANVWANIRHSGAIPAGTRMIRVLNSMNRLAGTSNDGYNDDHHVRIHHRHTDALAANVCLLLRFDNLTLPAVPHELAEDQFFYQREGGVATAGVGFVFNGTGAYGYEDDRTSYRLSGNFCIEVFGVQFDDHTRSDIICSQYRATGNQRSWTLTRTPTTLQFLYSTNGTALTTVSVAWVPTNGVEYDITVERVGGTIYLYVNGVIKVSAAMTTADLFNSTSPFGLGCQNTVDAYPTRQVMKGYMKAIRITKSATRHGGVNYTPAIPLDD